MSIYLETKEQILTELRTRASENTSLMVKYKKHIIRAVESNELDSAQTYLSNLKSLGHATQTLNNLLTLTRGV